MHEPGDSEGYNQGIYREKSLLKKAIAMLLRKIINSSIPRNGLWGTHEKMGICENEPLILTP